MENSDTFSNVYCSCLQKLQRQMEECKPLLEELNQQGQQLAELSPGEGASKVEELRAKDNSKFEGINSQVQKRADKISLQRHKSMEVCGSQHYLKCVMKKIIQFIHVEPKDT